MRDPTLAEKMLSEALYQMTGDNSHHDEVDDCVLWLRKLAKEIEDTNQFPSIGHTHGVFVVKAVSMLDL